MKKKIKDLTVSEIIDICNNTDCDYNICPFIDNICLYGFPFSKRIKKDSLEKEVDIDYELNKQK